MGRLKAESITSTSRAGTIAQHTLRCQRRARLEITWRWHSPPLHKPTREVRWRDRSHLCTICIPCAPYTMMAPHAQLSSLPAITAGWALSLRFERGMQDVQWSRRLSLRLIRAAPSSRQRRMCPHVRLTPGGWTWARYWPPASSDHSVVRSRVSPGSSKAVSASPTTNLRVRVRSEAHHSKGRRGAMCYGSCHV